MSKRKPMTPWEACGETREEYEAWEEREARAALIAAGIDPDAEFGTMLDEMVAKGVLKPCEAAACRESYERSRTLTSPQPTGAR